MIGLLLGAVFGLGFLLVLDAFTRPESDSGGITVDKLRQYAFRLGPKGAGALTGGLVALLVTGWVAAAVTGAALGWLAPSLVLRRGAERESLARMEAVAELAARLRDSIRSGMSLQESLVYGSRNPPPALQQELRNLVAAMRMEGLDAFLTSDSNRDEATNLLWAALRTSERLGAKNTTEVLDALSEASYSRALALREARARQARVRSSARIVAAVPVVLLLLIRANSPAYLEPFSEPVGQLVMLVGFGLIALGYLAMLRAARLTGV